LLLSENLELLDAICTSSPTVDGAAVAMSIMVLLQQQQLAEAFIKRLLVRKLKRESSTFFLSFFLSFFLFISLLKQFFTIFFLFFPRTRKRWNHKPFKR